MKRGGARLTRGHATAIGVMVFLTLLLAGTAWFSRSTFSAPLAAPDLLTTEERAWLQQHRVLRLAPDPNFPPIEYFDDAGRYRGLVADYYPLIEARLGVRFEIVRAATWDEVLEKAKRREVDVLGAAQRTPAREEYLNFTQPILDIPNVIIVRKDVHGVLNFSALGGKTLAVTRGNALDEYVRARFPEVRVVPVDSDLDGLREVSFGRIDATVVNLAIASHLIDRDGIANLRVAGDSGRSNALHIASRNDQPVLNRILSKGLAAITEDERQAINRRWIRLEGGPLEQRTLTILFWLALGAVAVIAAFLLLNLSLRRQVEARTAALNLELTERQRVEAELRALNATLDERVRTRTQELESAVREIESFSYSVSHDLRAPLRAFDGYSQMLAEDYGERLDDTARGYLTRMRTASQRMAELIDGLLDLARLSRRELRRETVDLSALAKELRAELEAAQGEGARQVAWTIEPGMVANADVSAVRSILGNLLGNAWKYTRPCARAEIAFGREHQEDHDVYFLRDNGVGFDMTYADKLFNAFQRLHRAADFEGTGLGLAAVRRLLERHGGRIWAESRPGAGAVFYFTLG